MEIALSGELDPAVVRPVSDKGFLAVVMPMPPYPAQRLMGMVHVAMFDAVNSIEHRYRPYLVDLHTTESVSAEAAAASAAVGTAAATPSATNASAASRQSQPQRRLAFRDRIEI